MRFFIFGVFLVPFLMGKMVPWAIFYSHGKAVVTARAGNIEPSSFVPGLISQGPLSSVAFTPKASKVRVLTTLHLKHSLANVDKMLAETHFWCRSKQSTFVKIVPGQLALFARHEAVGSAELVDQQSGRQDEQQREGHFGTILGHLGAILDSRKAVLEP